jgi:hypothetical protein
LDSWIYLLEHISAKKILRRKLSENLFRPGSGSGHYQKSDPDTVKYRPDPQQCYLRPNAHLNVIFLQITLGIFKYYCLFRFLHRREQHKFIIVSTWILLYPENWPMFRGFFLLLNAKRQTKLNLHNSSSYNIGFNVFFFFLHIFKLRLKVLPREIFHLPLVYFMNAQCP